MPEGSATMPVVAPERAEIRPVSARLAEGGSAGFVTASARISVTGVIGAVKGGTSASVIGSTGRTSVTGCTTSATGLTTSTTGCTIVSAVSDSAPSTTGATGSVTPAKVSPGIASPSGSPPKAASMGSPTSATTGATVSTGVVTTGAEGAGAVSGGAITGGCSAGSGTAVPGNAGMAAGSTAGRGGGATAGVGSAASRASCASEETSAPTPPAKPSAVPLTDETADEILPPSESDRCELSASAAGADTANQATAAAPASSTGRRGRSADHDKAAMVMLNTPKLTETIDDRLQPKPAAKWESRPAGNNSLDSMKAGSPAQWASFGYATPSCARTPSNSRIVLSESSRGMTGLSVRPCWMHLVTSRSS